MNEAALRKSIAKILRESSEPMDYAEIAWKLAENGKIAPFGVMPYRSVAAIIDDAIGKEGDGCPFVKTYPGVYILRRNARSGHLRAKALPHEVAKPALGIITCYGQVWDRDGVNWMPSAQIMGYQFKASRR
jgi:hypothetical protein